MKNLRKFNEDIDFGTQEKAKRVHQILDDFNDNFLEFLDEGHQYKLKLYKSPGESDSDFSATSTYEKVKSFTRIPTKYDGIMITIITNQSYKFFDPTSVRTSDTRFYDIQISQNSFDKKIDDIEKNISYYKKMKEEIQDNINRLVDFYKLELDDRGKHSGIYICKYAPSSEDYRLTFSFKIKI